MRQRLSAVFVAGAMLVGAATLCHAQNESSTPELVTDRPDFTESSEVVGHRVVQIESGLTFERTDSTLDQITAPQVLVRIGVGPRLELRFAGDGLVSQSVQTAGQRARATGHSDAEIGAKVKFLDASGAGVDMAVIPFMSLPTATDGFGTTGYDPGIKIAAARSLPHGFDLSGNFNVASITGPAGRVWEREASVSVGHGLAGPFGAYWEAYGTLVDGHCDCTLNTGLTVAVGANGQFDVEIGRGVSGDAQDWFVGFGVAVRRLAR